MEGDFIFYHFWELLSKPSLFVATVHVVTLAAIGLYQAVAFNLD